VKRGRPPTFRTQDSRAGIPRAGFEANSAWPFCAKPVHMDSQGNFMAVLRSESAFFTPTRIFYSSRQPTSRVLSAGSRLWPHLSFGVLLGFVGFTHSISGALLTAVTARPSCCPIWAILRALNMFVNSGPSDHRPARATYRAELHRLGPWQSFRTPLSTRHSPHSFTD
jgi:hypothetical protein